jgi:5-methylcytosine-specific restriction endonuclease McrA
MPRSPYYDGCVACPFCTLPASRIVAEDALTLTIRDGYPISPGHTLVITHRHVSSLFDATDEERRERRSLAEAQTILRDVQESRCLYCERAVGKDAAVDHFVPWSRYPVDFGHNLVLSHARCNANKSDSLAAFEHLHRWCDRNLEYLQVLADRFDEKGIAHNLVASWQITRWAYEQAESAHAQVWRDDRKSLDARWRSLPGVGAPE